MNDDSQGSNKPSRRDFTKAVAATLAATPLLHATAHAQSQSPQTKQPAQMTTQTPMEPIRTQLASPCHEHSVFKFRMDHIPPVVVNGSASVNMELLHEMSDGTLTTGHRRNLHLAKVPPQANQEYGDIGRVQVITEFEEYFSYYYYDFSPGYNAQLLLWIQDEKRNPRPQDPQLEDPPDSEAQMLIKGNMLHSDGMRVLHVESNKKLSNRKIKKKRRQEKYDHEGSGGNRGFRVGRWQLVRENGSTIPGFGDEANVSGATGYKFMISFFHVPPVKLTQ